MKFWPRIGWGVGALVFAALLFLSVTKGNAAEPPLNMLSTAHPRLFGSRQELKDLAAERSEAYRRMASVARTEKADDHAKMISMALVSAIEEDAALGAQTVKMAMTYINGPIRRGHVAFGSDLARCAIVYDLCHSAWTAGERERFHEYMNKTVDANVQSETHVFHNGWYGYKHWGVGLACYATMHENPRAPEILADLDQDLRARAAPALDFAGNGGGWAEGYYIHYFLYEWLVFCEVARRCDGVDYYALSPKFFKNRAVASMFEMYPGISTYGSRRPVPMGDGGGRRFGGDRDKALSARRILVNYYREDPVHQAVHVFNELTPRSSVGVYAYKDFLWRDPSVKQGNLSTFKLSHHSPGAGYVYARSSWNEDATYFFFKCGSRFTAHQHLDQGHFLIYRHAELAGDGGHYDGWTTPHVVNYYVRSIAHNTILVYDPKESWGPVRDVIPANDGGQAYPWHGTPFGHNGAVSDMTTWLEHRQLGETGRILAYEERGKYLYVAADASLAYAPTKLKYFIRQIVYLRPGTFVVFDRVKAARPEFKKTWLLQVMKTPSKQPPHLMVTNGGGKLFIQTLLPAGHRVTLHTGPDLYRYGGGNYPPVEDTGPAPECRIEVSPAKPSLIDYFLHVLTATDAAVKTVPVAAVTQNPDEVVVRIGSTEIRFSTRYVGMNIAHAAR